MNGRNTVLLHPWTYALKVVMNLAAVYDRTYTTVINAYVHIYGYLSVVSHFNVFFSSRCGHRTFRAFQKHLLDS